MKELGYALVFFLAPTFVVMALATMLILVGPPAPKFILRRCVGDYIVTNPDHTARWLRVNGRDIPLAKDADIHQLCDDTVTAWTQ
jgi:hypothetical protein